MAGPPRVLTVGDGFDDIASPAGRDISVVRAPDPSTAVEWAADERFDCVLARTDARTTGDGSVSEFYDGIRTSDPAVSVVLVGTDAGDVDGPEDASVVERVRADGDASTGSELGGVLLGLEEELASPEVLARAVEECVTATERERDRVRTRAQLEAFFEDNPDPAVEYEFVDGETRIRAVNRAFVETFGYDRETVVGEPLNDVVVPSGREDEAATLDERVAAGKRVVAEVRRRTSTGERSFRFKSIPVETDADGPDGYAIYDDVTEERDRERRLEAQNDRLDEFAGVVSHDLRSPLDVVKKRIEMARATDEPEHLDRAMESLDRMDELVRDLLAMAKQGEGIGRTEPVSLETVARTAWDHVATGESSLTIDADTRVVADSGRLTQLLENLYINAVQHNTGESDDADVSITVGVTEDGSGFYVADDGRGIPPGEREKVFESGYTTESDGTGYGLSIVRQVVRAHDWETTVCESEAGGARFEFRGVAFADD